MKILISLLFLVAFLSISCTKKCKDEILEDKVLDETYSYLLNDSALIRDCLDTTFNYEYHTPINKLISLNKLVSTNKLVYNLDTLDKASGQDFYYKVYSPGVFTEIYFMSDSLLIKKRLAGLGCNSWIVFSGKK
ncbi:MAG TPA: hypothetical protein PLU17_10600 [Chitinophagaceae bacterium]|nr:hypothetical protein [Chitinophagaceae bacterium]